MAMRGFVRVLVLLENNSYFCAAGIYATYGRVGLELFEFYHRAVFCILLDFRASPVLSISKGL